MRLPLAICLLILLTLTTFLTIAPAHASAELTRQLEKLPAAELEDLFGFVAGNVIFTLYHEGGHMLVSELSLPVLGQEEDAVDNLATVTMLAVDDEDMDLWLSTAMIGWFLIAEENLDDLPFYDEHALDLQRGYRMLCLMVGSDENAFAQFATDLELPAERMKTCVDDYEQARQSWDRVTDSHLRNNNDEPAGKISVIYRHASPDLETMEIFLKESGLLESAAEEFDTLYALPEKVTFTARSCGEENAYWDPDKREVTLCYELMAGFAEIYLGLVADSK